MVRLTDRPDMTLGVYCGPKQTFWCLYIAYYNSNVYRLKKLCIGSVDATSMSCARMHRVIGWFVSWLFANLFYTFMGRLK